MNFNLLWLDIETTGLCPVNDRILEIAWSITDLLGEPCLGEGTVLVDEGRGFPVDMHPKVLEMHTVSGLLEEWKACSSKWAVDAALKVIKSQLLQFPESDIRIAGNSIHYDISFLEKFSTWKEVSKSLSHRRYDTTSVLLAHQIRTGKDLRSTIPQMKHRALDDIRTSILYHKECIKY